MDYEDFTTRGTAAVLDLVAAQAQEGLHLELKSGQIFNDGCLDRKGRETLASTMSSFANSDGGLIVIGVDCRKGKDGVDAARELLPIKFLDRALTTMTELIADGLQPKHDGIEVQIARLDSASDQGFMAITVPRSSRRPHMNAFTKSYFKRAGASKFAMEHYDVEDAFKRQVGPDLELEYGLTAIEWPSQHGGVIWRYTLSLAAVNVGFGSAKFLVLRYPQDLPGITHESSLQPANRGARALYRGWQSWSLGSDIVVHPGSSLPFHNLFFSAVLDDNVVNSMAFGTARRLRIPYEIQAEGVRAKKGQIEIGPSDLRPHMRSPS